LVQDEYVYTAADRDRMRDWLLELASSDARVAGGAVLGSLAHGEGDRWSDLDLMFAVADADRTRDVLDDWTERLVHEHDATPLFDLQRGLITYRVFVFPNSLELDLSVTPAAEFGAAGPRFRLLFGEARELPETPPAPPEEAFGYAVHHALHARMCIERGRYWQAEYWISAVRDHALALACRSRGLDGSYGREFDRLPADVTGPAKEAMVRSLNPGELRRALREAVTALLRDPGEVGDMAMRVEGLLREAISTGPAAPA
jgi:hypothetical protein